MFENSPRRSFARPSISVLIAADVGRCRRGVADEIGDLRLALLAHRQVVRRPRASVSNSALMP